MSRPKGSKNKPKVAVVEQSVQPADVVANQPTDIEMNQPVKHRANKKAVMREHPEWVLTETMYGTPIAIVGIIKSQNWCYFSVIPHYETKSYRATINSISVMKPDFATPEIAKLYDGITFYVKHPVALNDVPEVATEPVAAKPDVVAPNDTLNAGI